MKEILLSALLFWQILNLTNAQIIHIGPTVGVNEVTISDLLPTPIGESSPKANIKFGFQAGAVINIQVYNKWSVEPSFLYYTCGAKHNSTFEAASNVINSGGIGDQDDPINTFTNTAYPITRTIDQTYIQFPVLIKYKLKSGLNFFAGPFWSLLLNAKENDNFGSYTLTNAETLSGNTVLSATSIIPEKSTTINLDSGNIMNSYDIGLRLGVGYDLFNGLCFSLGYNLGLAPIFISQTYAPQNQTSSAITVPAWGKNGAFTFSLKYMLGILKRN